MLRAEPDLSALQHWLQRHIVGDAMPAAGGTGVEPNLATPREVIRGSPRLPPEQRLGIYARSYVLRLLECLRAEFPAVRLLVGEQAFDLFGRAYLAHRPSTSYSLYDLGAGFADFLEATRPDGCARSGSLEAMPASLARLERAIADAQRGVGIEGLGDPDLPLPALLLFAPGVELRLPDTVTLLRLEFDFSETLASARRGEPPARPPACDAHVAVARTRYEVRVHALEPSRFAWLRAIGRQGAEIHRALAEAARTSRCSAEEIMVDLVAWLPTAIATGLVTNSPAPPVSSTSGDRMVSREISIGVARQ